MSHFKSSYIFLQSFETVSDGPVKTVFNAPGNLKDIIEDIWSDNCPVPGKC